LLPAVASNFSGIAARSGDPRRGALSSLAYRGPIGYTSRKPEAQRPRGGFMSDEADIDAGDAVRTDPNQFRDADGHLSRRWLDRLRAHLGEGDAAELAEITAPLHASDLGDVLEALDAEERLALVRLLGDKFDFSALTEVDDTIRSDIVEELSPEDIARGVSTLDTDDAVYILEDIDIPDREEILAQMPAFERLSLRRSLDFPEESAGRRMQVEFIAIPPFWTVGQTIDYMRSEKELPDEFYQIYVVDPTYNLLGTLALDKFLRAKRGVRIEDLMNRNIITVDAGEDQEEAARVFERYDLVEVGVVDENRRLVGVLTIDDIVDVIHEEASEDIHRLAGVGDEEISDNVWSAVRSRSTWLVVNLVTAVLASLVIGLFDATIEQMVALAVLMPIVASMGGNAGTQTMTITVRALALRELDRSRMVRLIAREMTVGFVNGVLFALLIGLITAVRFANVSLGVVIGMAMIVNMIAAGAAGILIPLGLNRLKIDPAIASSVFVTTITDVIGFFAFLGLAGLWFGLF
jgi:magnesium transporter